MKTAIIYSSVHHGNTKKILEAMFAGKDVSILPASVNTHPDLTGYDLICFASGIYYGKFHKTVLDAMKNCAVKPGQKAILVYTSGSENIRLDSAESILKERELINLGHYGCLGFDTFGPLKLIGGLAKGHPDAEELENAKKFINGIEAALQ